MIKIIKQKMHSLLLLIFSFSIIAFTISLAIYPKQEKKIEEKFSLYPFDSYLWHSSAYDIGSDEYFLALSSDPQLVFYKLNTKISFFEIQFAAPTENDMAVQLYWSTEENDFDEQHSVSDVIQAGETNFSFEIPEIDCINIRIDINGNFYLKNIFAGNTQIITKREWIKNIYIACIIFFSTLIIYLFIKVFVHYVFRLYSKKIIILFSLMFCTVVFLGGIIKDYERSFVVDDITNLKIKNQDNAIFLEWTTASLSKAESITLTITGNNNVISETFSPFKSNYLFTAGVHGEIYTFSLTPNYKNEKSVKPLIQTAIFLDLDKLPNIPIVSIYTENEEIPSSDPIALFNHATVNSEYLNGYMTMNKPMEVNTKMKIRVRGNTSAANDEKKPYKIILDNPIDLLGRGDVHADKEWLLIKSTTPLKTYTCHYIAEICGSEWQPNMLHVNLMINDQWNGLYTLIESVKVSPSRLNISDTGFLYEHDVYWWNSDRVNFSTCLTDWGIDNNVGNIKYTVKYPQCSMDDIRIIRLSDYVNNVDAMIMNNDEDVLNYIDVESFVTWLMIHDVIGNADPAGSNQFYYKYDYNFNDPTASKLKMGPTWDYDGAFFPEYKNKSIITRVWPGLYFSWINNDAFWDVYYDKWEKVSPHIVSDVSNHLEKLYNESLEPLNESKRLDAALWGYEYIPVNNEGDEYISWLEEHVSWLDDAINQQKTEKTKE